MTVATYPTYDGSADASAWFYGVAPGHANGGTGSYSPNDTTASKWYCWTMPLDLQPGTYYVTSVFLMAAFTLEADIGNVYFSIFEDSAGTLTPITFGNGLTYIDQTADVVHANGNNSHVGPTTVASVSFTLESGKTYQMGWGMQRSAVAAALHPGVMVMNDGMGPQGLTVYKTNDLTTFPSVHAASVVAGGEIPRGYITFTTPVRTLYSAAYSAAKDILIPRRTDGNWCMKFRAAVVADGQALTAVLHNDNAGNDATRTTLLLDMGDTHQVGFASELVALDASETADTFDLLYEQRADGKADLFYLNKTTGQGPLGADDFATISHAVKHESTRGYEYTIATPDYLKITGTAAVAAIQVGWEPIVIFGDSQCSRNGEVNISSSYRLGSHLPTAFTHDRIYWMACIAGSLLTANNGTSHTAAYLRYKSATPGQGDLCEMTTPLFIIGGIGINDISVVVGSTEANRNKIIGLLATRFSEILDDLQDRAIPTLIIGLPPYSKSGDADEAEAQCVKNQINPMLEGLAIGVRAAYLNPWWDVVEQSTANDAVPTFLAGYTEDGLHYDTVGAAYVAGLAATALESGVVGGPWTKRNTRGRRPGLLLPI
jgi:hypothetical protein